MNRNYETSRAILRAHPHLPQWAASRETAEVVAVAIHAIADRNRSPEEIWASPTLTEWEHVAMAVQEYVTQGDYPPSDDGRYAWGEEHVSV